MTDSTPGPGQVDGIPSTLAQDRPSTAYSGHSQTLTYTTSVYSEEDLVRFKATRDEGTVLRDLNMPSSTYTVGNLERTHTFADQGEPGQETGHVGYFWVGTYEKRPNSGVAAGSVQGDVPQGTLTSDPFVVAGTEISFLIGGGCREEETYVELVVDGLTGLASDERNPTGGGMARGHNPLKRSWRSTGRCEETMRRVSWDVSAAMGRTAQIRVVDASSKRWAHINVDDFQFSWDNGGAKGESATSRVCAAQP